MKEMLGSIGAFISLPAFLLGLVALVRPLPKLKLPTRTHAAVLTIISFIAMGISGALLPPVPQNPPAEPTGKVVKATAEVPTEPAAKPPVTVNFAAEVVALGARVETAASPCEEVGETVNNAFRSNKDAVSLYELLMQAKEICKAASREIRGLPVPTSIDRNQRKTLKAALQECGSAYSLKGGVYRDIAEAMDNGARTSEMADLRSRVPYTLTAKSDCRSALASATEAASHNEGR